MSWNEPGRDPWKDKKNASPPDLDKMIAQFFRKLARVFAKTSVGGGGSSQALGGLFGLVVLIVVILWAVSGFYIVDPAENAVVLRFGKYIGTETSGLHWIPRFIDSKRTVNVQRIYSFPLNGDFLTKSSGDHDAKIACVPSNAPGGGGCVDQSKNLVDIELTVMYRIGDPRKYLYGVVGPDETIRQLADSSLSQVAGSMKLDEVLTSGRELLASRVQDRLRAALNVYPAGLDVVKVTLRKVQAPDQVREAFNDVNRAIQDKKTAINQSEAYASKVIPLAKGEAARILAKAGAYEERVTLLAKADVARYQALLDVYRVAPKVTKTRLYFDALQTLLEKNTKILVDIDRSAGASNVIYLPLDRMMRKSSDDGGVSSSEEAR